MNFKPKDMVALTAILCITILKLNHFNGYLDGVLSLIVGYYFAHRRAGNDTGV